jgi:hypothetical protein
MERNYICLKPASYKKQITTSVNNSCLLVKVWYQNRTVHQQTWSRGSWIQLPVSKFVSILSSHLHLTLPKHFPAYQMLFFFLPTESVLCKELTAIWLTKKRCKDTNTNQEIHLYAIPIISRYVRRFYVITFSLALCFTHTQFLFYSHEFSAFRYRYKLAELSHNQHFHNLLLSQFNCDFLLFIFSVSDV